VLCVVCCLSVVSVVCCLSLVSVVCCQVEIARKDRTLVQRSPTELSVSESDREASTMSRPWPTMVCCAMGWGDIVWVTQSDERRQVNGKELF